MPEIGVVKYLVKLRFEVEGVVEKADVIGAIFGQTEGLFGPELNLNELQKTWKVGRIEIDLKSDNGKTFGEVSIPMSTDISTAAIVAAGVESVEKVGPCAARFKLVGIEDVRVTKRKAIIERAKGIMREWSSRSASEGEEILRDVMDSAKRARVISYGREELPAGPGVYMSDMVILVEGRADVISLLRAGVENVVALNGAKVPDSIIRLSKEKNVIAFLDGDRGGDLIVKELSQVANVKKIIRAPSGREVEDLTPIEVLEILRQELPPVKPRQVEIIQIEASMLEKVKEIYPKVNGTLEAVILDEKLNELAKVPVSELVQRLETASGARHVVFDGIVTQRLLDVCEKAGLTSVFGHRLGEISRRPQGVTVSGFRELGVT